MCYDDSFWPLIHQRACESYFTAPFKKRVGRKRASISKKQHKYDMLRMKNPKIVDIFAKIAYNALRQIW